MRIKRRGNVSGRTEGDYKPWLDRESASRLARKPIERGCLLCGAKTSIALMEGPDGETIKGEYWHVLTDMKTGAERVMCALCHSAKAAFEKGCAVCKKTLGPDSPSEGWNVQCDSKTGLATTVLCPTCHVYHTQGKGCDGCGIKGSLFEKMDNGNSLGFYCPPLVPEPLFICSFCLKDIAGDGV